MFQTSIFQVGAHKHIRFAPRSLCAWKFTGLSNVHCFALPCADETFHCLPTTLVFRELFHFVCISNVCTIRDSRHSLFLFLHAFIRKRRIHIRIYFYCRDNVIYCAYESYGSTQKKINLIAVFSFANNHF